MSGQVEQRVRECKTRGCGHDRASHYRDARGEGNCLCRGCVCEAFQEEHDTLPHGMKALAVPPEPFAKAPW